MRRFQKPRNQEIANPRYFVDHFLSNFWWTVFCGPFFVEYFVDHLLWTVFYDPFFVAHFSWIIFCRTIFSTIRDRNGWTIFLGIFWKAVFQKKLLDALESNVFRQSGTETVGPFVWIFFGKPCLKTIFRRPRIGYFSTIGDQNGWTIFLDIFWKTMFKKNF